MASAQITITENGIKIEVIGKLKNLSKLDIQTSAEEAVKMLEEVNNEE